MRRQCKLPFLVSDAVHLRGRHGGEIVAIGIVVSQFVAHVRLIQLLAVAVHHTVPQMNLVSGNADDALHHEEALFLGRQEHHDVASPDVAVGQQRSQPARLGGKLLAVHEHVIPDEQRVLHRTGGNFKCLQDKRDDEQARDQHSCQGRQKFHRGLARLLFFSLLYFFIFLRHVTHLFRRLFPQRTSRNVRSQRVIWKKCVTA